VEYPRRKVCLVTTGVEGAGAARRVGLADEANDLEGPGALSEAAKRRINRMVVMVCFIAWVWVNSPSALSLQPTKHCQLCDVTPVHSVLM